MLDRDLPEVRRDVLSLLSKGVDALADLGSEDAYELLQEVARVAAGSDAPYTGVARDAAMVELSTTLLSAHRRAVEERRLEHRRAQLRSAVAEVVEASVRDRDVATVLSAAVRALRRVMWCQGASIRAFDVPDSTPKGRYSASHPPEVDDFLDERMVEIASDVARIHWERQTVSLLHVDQPDVEPLTTVEARDFAFDFMRMVGAREMLLAPMGADGRCIGWVAMTRAELDEPFGPDDVQAVLAIGREVGNAVRHAVAFERQQALIGQLRELSNHKSTFTATLAHQLRNPLTSIRLHVEELEEHVDVEEQPECGLGLAAISRSTQMIETTVESLLALAGLEEPRRPLLARPVQLDRLVLDGAAMVTAAAEALDLTIDTSQVEPGTWVSGDLEELAMVVDNVLGNAVKYSRRGSTIRLRVDRHDGGVRFRCADQGIGMSAEDLERLFDPFHRASEVQGRKIPGSGLGMAIVKAAVDRHDGRITVSSGRDCGTRVAVWLPEPVRS